MAGCGQWFPAYARSRVRKAHPTESGAATEITGCEGTWAGANARGHGGGSRGGGAAPTRRRSCRHGLSDVKTEVDDVAVLDNIVLAFRPQLARLFRPLLATAGDEVIVGDGLRADEAALEIGMDLTRRLGCG